jgi:hypothetical protein
MKLHNKIVKITQKAIQTSRMMCRRTHIIVMAKRCERQGVRMVYSISGSAEDERTSVRSWVMKSLKEAKIGRCGGGGGAEEARAYRC